MRSNFPGDMAVLNRFVDRAHQNPVAVSNLFLFKVARQAPAEFGTLSLFLQTMVPYFLSYKLMVNRKLFAGVEVPFQDFCIVEIKHLILFQRLENKVSIVNDSSVGEMLQCVGKTTAKMLSTFQSIEQDGDYFKLDLLRFEIDEDRFRKYIVKKHLPNTEEHGRLLILEQK